MTERKKTGLLKARKAVSLISRDPPVADLVTLSVHGSSVNVAKNVLRALRFEHTYLHASIDSRLAGDHKVTISPQVLGSRVIPPLRI
jgi:hypothetical protein